MTKPRRASYAVTSAELPVLKTLGLEEADPEDVFELQRKEGAGAFGRVFRACYKDDRTRLAALKVIPVALEAGERGEDIESVRREIQFLRECDHPNVVAFHGAYYKDGALWVAMEHCAGGSVGDVRRVRPLSEREISVIMRGALHGLAYLHSRRKIHRDVKGGNILLTDSGQVKIADFGVSAQLRDTLSRRGSFVGTPYWMSPELIQDSDYDFKADIWSLGITAIELADQKPPLFDEHPMRVLIQIPRNPPPQVAHPDKWSAAFLAFLRFCLRKDPAERPTALECMQHEFIRREAHIEKVFASGERDDNVTEGVQVASTSMTQQTDEVSVGVAALAPTIEQELDQEIAEEINDEGALSESSASPHSEAEEEASTELLGETFELRESAAQSSIADTSLSTAPRTGAVANSLSSADELLNVSADTSFALENEFPALSQADNKLEQAGQQVQTRVTSQQLQSTVITSSFRQPPTQFKLIPSSAKSPGIRSNTTRDSSTRFAKLNGSSRISSGAAQSFASDGQVQKPPRPSSRSISFRPKTSKSPPASPSVHSSWSSSQDDPLASIDTVTNARVNRLLSSFSASTSAPTLAAAMRAYNDQYVTDTPSRSVTRQSFNWRSVEAALPSPKSTSSRETSTRSSGKIFVGDPFRASHDVCVKYNSIQAQYEGAPLSAEWAALHQQFGIALSHMRCRSTSPHVANSEDHVPALLRMLRRELVRHGGLECKYIYRVSPVQEEVQRAKAAINRGSFELTRVSDPHVYASLLKLWLRELPALLLDALDVQDLAAITRLAATRKLEDEEEDDLHLVTPGNIDVVDDQITRTLRKLGPREHVVFQWLLEHMLEVSTHRSLNQMTTQALATVMAPNVFSCAGMARSTQENAGNLMHQIVLFLRVLLSWRRSNLGKSFTYLLEQEETNVSSTSIETSELKKASSLQQRVRQSLTKLIQSTEENPESEDDFVANVSLEDALRSRVDKLWSELENSEITCVETKRQENVLRRVFREFQQSVLQLIARYSKKREDCLWANDLLDKLKRDQPLDETIPSSLERMNEWVAAAMTFEAFCRLLDREQTTQDKFEKFQVRFGSTGDNNQVAAAASSSIFTRSVFYHLSRVHRQQFKATVAPCTTQSNQSDDRVCASKTENLLLNGAVSLAGRGICTGNDVGTASKPHHNVAKLGERQPAIGNLLVLLGDRSQSRLQTGTQWLQEQIMGSVSSSTAL